VQGLDMRRFSQWRLQMLLLLLLLLLHTLHQVGTCCPTCPRAHARERTRMEAGRSCAHVQRCGGGRLPNTGRCVSSRVRTHARTHAWYQSIACMQACPRTRARTHLPAHGVLVGVHRHHLLLLPLVLHCGGGRVRLALPVQELHLDAEGRAGDGTEDAVLQRSVCDVCACVRARWCASRAKGHSRVRVLATAAAAAAAGILMMLVCVCVCVEP